MSKRSDYMTTDESKKLAEMSFALCKQWDNEQNPEIKRELLSQLNQARIKHVKAMVDKLDSAAQKRAAWTIEHLKNQTRA